MPCLSAFSAPTGAAAAPSVDEPPSRPPLQRPSLLQPVFLNTTRHVQVPVGRPAYLNCIVQHTGDRTVSAECTPPVTLVDSPVGWDISGLACEL